MEITKGGNGLRERLFLTLLGDSGVPSLSCTKNDDKMAKSKDYHNVPKKILIKALAFLLLVDMETGAGCGGVFCNKSVKQQY